MKLKEKIEKVIENIEKERGYEFVGKTIKGITYYTFIDADYIQHYYSAQYMIEEAKEI